ncbi:hypothetical protein KQX54_014248 [Cotesia glomerata]|uniref:Cadherin domain-containing protein n=1 Tax=Cotesia glomerata TaxID=32391 RepID=A0AAV7J0D5_COTGL|nr:hypothetical protein KQX54_014248 [Cotesia glomerata]
MLTNEKAWFEVEGELLRSWRAEALFAALGDHEFFKLDKDTRNLTITKALDRETQDIMSILIIATPNSEGPPRDPRKEATLNITIIVVDENDNAPSFEIDFYSGGITTSDPVNRTILIIKVCKLDFI